MARTHTTLTSLFTDIADSIREKTGDTADIVADNFPTAIANIPSGSIPVDKELKDVNFYDYKGLRVYSYTKDEFLALENMPAFPTNEDMTYDEWNWSLADAKTYVQENQTLNIGGICHTTDNKTRIYIELMEKKPSSLYLGITIKGTCSVDWGDDSTSTLTGTSLSTVKVVEHTYTSSGNYVITLSFDEGTTFGLKGQTNWSYLLYAKTAIVSTELRYQSSIKEIKFSNQLKQLDMYAFRYLTNLKHVNLPMGIKIESYVFDGCYSLEHLNTPSDISKLTTNGGSYNAQSCYSLKCVACGKTNFFENYGYYNCRSLRVNLPCNTTLYPNQYGFNHSLCYAYIPKEVSLIYANVFTGCNSLKWVSFENHTSIPTLDNKSAIPTHTYIIVPDALYDDWKVATNWSNLASKIVKYSEYVK